MRLALSDSGIIGGIMRTVLIDGDILLYKSGFAIQSKKYIVNDVEAEEMYSFSTKTELDNFLSSISYEVEVTEKIDHAPFKVGAAILKKYIDTIIKETKATNHIIYVGSSTNHKYRENTSIDYKGNRTADDKPIYYGNLNAYLRFTLGAEIVRGMETDDALGIAQTKDTIIATVDKDLRMIPGWHYNINTGQREKIKTELGYLKYNDGKIIGGGFKWFCAQMIMGDKVDNIPGLSGHGPSAAFKHLNSRRSIKTCWDTVLKLYKLNKSEHLLLDTANLLWILRKEDEYFEDWLGSNI